MVLLFLKVMKSGHVGKDPAVLVEDTTLLVISFIVLKCENLHRHLVLKLWYMISNMGVVIFKILPACIERCCFFCVCVC